MPKTTEFGLRQPEGASPKQLRKEQIDEIRDKVHFSEDDFESEIQPDAIEYRGIILTLAEIFCEKVKGWSYELTHSEYFSDTAEGRNWLDLCMEFNKEQSDGEYEQKRYDEFKKFLEENIHLIPHKLRQKFDMYIGFNYGNFGAIVISEEKINLITQEVYERLQSAGSIGYTNDMKKERAFRNMIRDKIHELMGK